MPRAGEGDCKDIPEMKKHKVCGAWTSGPWGESGWCLGSCGGRCVCRVPPKGHRGPASASLALPPAPPRLCAFYIPPSAAASATPQMPSLLCARWESPLHGSSTDLWDSGCGPPAGPHRGSLLMATGLPWTVQVPRLSQQGGRWAACGTGPPKLRKGQSCCSAPELVQVFALFRDEKMGLWEESVVQAEQGSHSALPSANPVTSLLPVSVHPCTVGGKGASPDLNLLSAPILLIGGSHGGRITWRPARTCIALCDLQPPSATVPTDPPFP